MVIGKETIREAIKANVSGKEGIAHIKDTINSIFIHNAWPGGYTVIFIDNEGSVLCADCAKDEYLREHTTFTSTTYDEGPVLICEGCNKEIEASYGDPDAV